MQRLAVTAGVVVCLASTMASAQDLLPLRELIVRGAEDTYPMVRCAAFYQATGEWAGDALSEEARERIARTVANLIVIAVQVRSDGRLDDATVKFTQRDMQNIKTLYLERFEANYAAVGQAWGEDDLWQSDSDTCGYLMGANG